MGTLTLQEIGNLLEATPALLRVQLGGLDDAILRWRPDIGEWCIKEVIGHLIETDRIAFMGRVQQMLDADYPTLGGMDVNDIAAARHDDERDLGELLDELTTLRAEISPKVSALHASDLARAGAYPRLESMSVQDLVYEWPFHDANHIKQIQDIIMAWSLPGMGEAMRKAVTS